MEPKKLGNAQANEKEPSSLKGSSLFQSEANFGSSLQSVSLDYLRKGQMDTTYHAA
jgi:hypothetical protein